MEHILVSATEHGSIFQFLFFFNILLGIGAVCGSYGESQKVASFEINIYTMRMNFYWHSEVVILTTHL